ncbi:MAG: lipocalin-like domain-containing protein [Anaerolineae bacterium]|nr:lipocalin-like domain-containing protein [Anaerolineae bacterium]
MSIISGTYQLHSATFYKPSGEALHLYGEKPLGMLIYTPDGRMAGQGMQQDRPPLPRNLQAPAALADYQAILKGYIAYWGTYTLDEAAQTVTHHVLGSLIPNWVGGDQVRHYEVGHGRLILRTPPAVLRGEALAGELVWLRV